MEEAKTETKTQRRPIVPARRDGTEGSCVVPLTFDSSLARSVWSVVARPSSWILERHRARSNPHRRRNTARTVSYGWSGREGSGAKLDNLDVVDFARVEAEAKRVFSVYFIVSVAKEKRWDSFRKYALASATFTFRMLICVYARMLCVCVCVCAFIFFLFLHPPLFISLTYVISLARKT